MFSALHPALLGGLALISVPILIHLLLRQRPQPRPWAAMRWLLAAAQRAQRRYKLTNLLLLLMRCALVALIALALARPSLAGLGGGDSLVLILDISASMGARGTDPGPLAAAKAALPARLGGYRAVTLIAVAADARVLTETTAGAATDALSALEASALPGGLDDSATGAAADTVLAALGTGSDVLLVSDFQRDDGSRLSAALTPHCRRVARWQVGRATANATIAGVELLAELHPGNSGELSVRFQGVPKAIALAIDQGPFLAAEAPIAAADAAKAGSAAAAESSARLRVPPLTAGAHLLRVRAEDDSLAYDNLLELPVQVREQLPALIVADGQDYLAASLRADAGRGEVRTISGAQFAGEALPPQGLLALRAPVADATRMKDWLNAGGVLWATRARLSGDAQLAPLLTGLTADGTTPGGKLNAGAADLDEVLALVSLATVPTAALPPKTEIALSAGTAPVVVALPIGKGWVVVELVDLGANDDFVARGTTPLWAVRTARRYAARSSQPALWQAGLPAPAAAVLEHGGEALPVKSGAALMVPTGAYTNGGSAVVVLPNLVEGRLEQPASPDLAGDLARALPAASGADLGRWLIVVALALALGEWAFAAWAGKTYGR